MTNILFIIETGGPGGAEKVVLNQVKYINRKLFNPFVVVLKKDWIYDQLKKYTKQVFVIPSPIRFDFTLILKLYRFIKKYHLHVVQSHLMDTNFYSAIASFGAGVPHVATEHGDIHIDSLTAKTRLKIALTKKLTTSFIAVSKYTQTQIAKIVSDKTKLKIIYNGVPCLNESRDNIRSELGLRGKDFIVLNIGNLYPVKDQMNLIRAAAKIAKIRDDIYFLIAGRGELHRQLANLISEFRLQNNVFLLGFRSDLERLFSSSDIYVQSSLSEGLPLAVIEAMSSKKPVIATNVGGTNELIDKVLIPPQNSEVMAQNILSLIEDKAKRNLLAEEAYDRYLKYFTIDNMIQQYEQLYLNLL